MKLRKKVCSNIRKIRRAKDLSQDALAEGAQTDRVHISNIERGLVNISIDMIERIAKSLKIDPKDLFGD